MEVTPGSQSCIYIFSNFYVVGKGGFGGGGISLMVLLLLSRIGSVLVYAMLVLVLPFPRLLVGGRWLLGHILPGILSLVVSSCVL